MNRGWKRAAIPSQFAFLASDDLEAARRLSKVPEAKRPQLAHELALAFHAAHDEPRRRAQASEAKANAARVSDALALMEQAEQRLRAADWEDFGDRVRALRSIIDKQAGAFSRVADAVSGIPLPLQYSPWPEPVKVNRRPPAWRQRALARIRALGFGRPGADALLKIATEAGRAATSIPSAVQSALDQEREALGGWRVLTEPAPPAKRRRRAR